MEGIPAHRESSQQLAAASSSVYFVPFTVRRINPTRELDKHKSEIMTVRRYIGDASRGIIRHNPHRRGGPIGGNDRE